MPLIHSEYVVRRANEPAQVVRNQLNRWANKGLLVRLRRGVYTLNDNDRKADVSRMYIANQIYVPSYVSMESALSFYGFIPEKVESVTSVSTLKTMRFSNLLGQFVYQHVLPRAFRGFKNAGSAPGQFLIAEPEKAVADFLYLNLRQFGRHPERTLVQSYRFQNLEELNRDRFLEYGELFQSKKLKRVMRAVAGMIHEDER